MNRVYNFSAGPSMLPEWVLKKAADEMLNRATTVLDNRCEKVAGGTFHSFANFVLRKYSGLLELKNNFTKFF